MISQAKRRLQAPTVSSAMLTEHLCDIDQPTERWLYSRRGHVDVVTAALNDMAAWIDARFAPQRDSVPPPRVVPTGPDTADPEVTVTGCPRRKTAPDR